MADAWRSSSGQTAVKQRSNCCQNSGPNSGHAAASGGREREGISTGRRAADTAGCNRLQRKRRKKTAATGRNGRKRLQQAATAAHSRRRRRSRWCTARSPATASCGGYGGGYPLAATPLTVRRRVQRAVDHIWVSYFANHRG
jgi:hypothetical protein